ncbi:uncharacterized protein LOC131327600 [Rhododendron vialii]|uniref:uncharacterized protein LOC131327600 n=1 Tax=Rhododendron vialii TaxID=182163 RepID=UPI00265F4BC0|nr:uncharacterized protein LOC131327600 [Rhododendron vialii]
MRLGRKKGCEEEVCNEGIVFTDEDLGGVQAPHNDALVITLRIGEYDTERILVDSGSCAEALYYDAFKNGGAVWPLGKVTLLVRAGTVMLRTDFLVVDVSSSYNAIIGRTWLHNMRAVSSTYHQMAPKAKLVQAIEVPDQLTIEDVGGNLAEKVVEDLKKVQINKTDPERYFLITENLNKEEEKELVGFLKEHVDVFAWVPEEMLGVDANVICHHLNVDPQHKPVMQKKRRSTVQHIDVFIEEVDHLLEAKAIRQVYYLEWLSNTEKKNGKWRVCVDFTDLNKACPKDSFPLLRIDQLVDSTTGYGRMSFLDA